MLKKKSRGTPEAVFSGSLQYTVQRCKITSLLNDGVVTNTPQSSG